MDPTQSPGAQTTPTPTPQQLQQAMMLISALSGQQAGGVSGLSDMGNSQMGAVNPQIQQMMQAASAGNQNPQSISPLAYGQLFGMPNNTSAGY